MVCDAQPPPDGCSGRPDAAGSTADHLTLAERVDCPAFLLPEGDDGSNAHTDELCTQSASLLTGGALHRTGWRRPAGNRGGGEPVGSREESAGTLDAAAGWAVPRAMEEHGADH